MRRIIDILISFILLSIFGLPMIMLAVVIRLESLSPAIFWSKRVGVNNICFMMPKFRTMHHGTVAVAIHFENPDKHLTRLGDILRRTSIDELPRLTTQF